MIGKALDIHKISHLIFFSYFFFYSVRSSNWKFIHLVIDRFPFSMITLWLMRLSIEYFAFEEEKNRLRMCFGWILVLHSTQHKYLVYFVVVYIDLLGCLSRYSVHLTDVLFEIWKEYAQCEATHIDRHLFL